MRPDEFGEIQEIFLSARGLSGEARTRHLDAACGDRPDVRNEVESLLEADAPTEHGFLEAPALGAGFHVGEGSGGSSGSSGDTMEVMPDRIGVYKLLQKIGEGGFGTVYMGEQEEPVRRRVALKVIKLGMDTKQVIARFEAERQALAMMDHPNIARVLDAGSTETGRPYFVMELVRGVPITEYCNSARLTLKARLSLFISVCHAVQHAHQKGIIHRDIKPSNVMITLHGGRPSPKVIDFGVAKATNQRLTEHTLFTQYGQFIGTPEYMSPEQAEMSALDVDTRSDIYSLGVLLFELLTGTTPFGGATLRGKSFSEIQRIIKEDEPPKPSTRVSTGGAHAVGADRQRIESPAQLSRMLRGDLDWIVLKALDKDRERRYETASGFALDVECFLSDEPVAAGPPSTRYRLGKFVKRNRVGVAAGCAVASVLLLGIVGTSVGMRWALRERGVAQDASAQARSALGAAESAREALLGSNEELEMRRTEAEHQARLARSVLDYVTGDLIEAVHPDQLGRDATLREWLDSASRSLGREVTPFVDEPEALISLDHAIGSAYLELSDPERALEHLERAYERSVRELGGGRAQTLRIAVTLGQARFDLLDPEGSIGLLSSCLRICREKHADDVGLLIDLMNVLTESLDFQASYDLSSDAREEARRLAYEAVELSEGSGDGRRLVNSLNRLSQIELTAGHAQEARRASLHAVEAAELSYGPNHAETIRAKRQLAMRFVYETDNREAGVELLREAARATREVFGTDSRIYLMIQHEFAMQFAAMGRAQEASDAYLEAVENRASVLGPDHTWTLGMRLERASWPLRVMGRTDEALAEGWAVVERAREVYGDEDGFTGYAASVVAGLCDQEGKEEEALLAWSLAVRAMQASAPGTGVVAEYAQRYASLLERLGRREEALDVLRGILGDDPSVLVVRVDLRSAAAVLVGCLDEEAGGPQALAEAEKWRGALDAWWLTVIDQPDITARELDEMARRLLAGDRAELRDAGAAARVARRAVEMDGGREAGYLETLVRAQHASGQPEGVCGSASRLLTHIGANAESLVALARLLVGQDAYGRRYMEEGLALAERAVEMTGGEAFAPLHALADAHRATGQRAEEVSSWRRAVAASDVSAWAHESFAWLLGMLEEEELRDDAEALAQVERAFELENGQGAIWRWRTLAMLQRANGRVRESTATWLHLLKLEDATAANLGQISRGLVREYPERMRDAKMGLVLAEQAVEMSEPANQYTLQTLAIAQQATGDDVGELGTWRRIALLEEAGAWVNEMYAWKLLVIQDDAYWEDAEVLRVMRSENRNEDRLWHWRTLACAERANGLVERSRESWRRVVEHPGATAQNLIPMVLGLIERYPMRVQDPEMGVVLARRVVDIDGGVRYRSQRLLARALHASGRHDEEIEVWKRAAECADAPASARVGGREVHRPQ